jgi:hypothetical protein
MKTDFGNLLSPPVRRKMNGAERMADLGKMLLIGLIALCLYSVHKVCVLIRYLRGTKP